MTDALGQSQVIPYLKALSEKGFSFHIISCEKKKNFISQKENVSRDLKDYNITWHPLFYSKTPPIISTIYDVLKIKCHARALHKKEKFQIVHCRSYISSLIGLWMKNKFNIKFIFDMRGFWVNERVEGDLWNLKNPVYKIIYDYFKRKEKKFLTNADYIISLTQSGKKEINSWNLVSSVLPIEVIPCCVDTVFFSPENINKEIKNKYKNFLKFSENDFILSYLGAIGTWYMLDEMLLFFRTLLKLKPNAKFLFITQENSSVILQKASRLNIPLEKIIIQKALRKEVPVLLSLSNLSIFFIKPLFSKQASSPTKMGEIMAMGIPIICNSRIGDVDQIIHKSRAGILVDELDENNFVNAIQQLNELNLPEKIRIREEAINYFSLENGINLYRKVYLQLLS